VTESQTVGPRELPKPLEDNRRELKQQALTQVIQGQATPVEINGSTVVQVGTQPGAANDAATRQRTNPEPAKDQFVELAREKTFCPRKLSL
jgi:immune inhibitor A